MADWMRVKKFDHRACELADRHYSRRTPGSDQFMPPGQTIVLLTTDARAVFGWWRPDPASGLRAMNGLDGWTCTIFRHESSRLSSTLILAAENELYRYADDVGPDGLITYVWDQRVRSSNPGYCFLCAGWRRTGRSADGRKTLLQKERRVDAEKRQPYGPPLVIALAALAWRG
jgi:hypothetical protein